MSGLFIGLVRRFTAVVVGALAEDKAMLDFMTSIHGACILTCSCDLWYRKKKVEHHDDSLHRKHHISEMCYNKSFLQWLSFQYFGNWIKRWKRSNECRFGLWSVSNWCLPGRIHATLETFTDSFTEKQTREKIRRGLLMSRNNRETAWFTARCSRREIANCYFFEWRCTQKYVSVL